MDEKLPPKARRIMDERFGRDTLIALATVDGNIPNVRTVNAYYENGAFYVITHAQSNKMKQIAENPNVRNMRGMVYRSWKRDKYRVVLQRR